MCEVGLTESEKGTSRS